jgi:hypothetical protein
VCSRMALRCSAGAATASGGTSSPTTRQRVLRVHPVSTRLKHVGPGRRPGGPLVAAVGAFVPFDAVRTRKRRPGCLRSLSDRQRHGHEQDTGLPTRRYPRTGRPAGAADPEAGRGSASLPPGPTRAPEPATGGHRPPLGGRRRAPVRPHPATAGCCCRRRHGRCVLPGRDRITGTGGGRASRCAPPRRGRDGAVALLGRTGRARAGRDRRE